MSDADWQRRCAEVDATAKKIADEFMAMCK